MMVREGSERPGLRRAAFVGGLTFGLLVGIYAVVFLSTNWNLTTSACVSNPFDFFKVINGGKICWTAGLDLTGIAGVMFLSFLTALLLYLAIIFALLFVAPPLRGGLGPFLIFASSFIVVFVVVWFVGSKAVGV